MIGQIFDMQFWSLLLIGTVMVFFGGWILKNVVVTAVSKAVAEVVRDQWSLMFKKIDEYSEKVEKLQLKYEELTEKEKENRDEIAKLKNRFPND